MPRLFVAVVPPDEVLDVIAALPRPEAPGVRWTGRDQWHVTLRFLGEADVDDAVRALDGATWARCRAELGPAVRRLGRNVLCVPAAGLDDLAGAVVEATAAVGRPPEKRPFRGHLTLARCRAKPPRDAVGRPVAAEFPVDAVHLIQSHLGGPHPARYELLHSFSM